MAVNETRSMNNDLIEGLTDGMLIKRTPLRGGDVEHPDTVGWNNEQHGHGAGDAHVRAIANRVYGINGVKRSGHRTH